MPDNENDADNDNLKHARDDVRCEAARRYIEAFEQVTGRAFEPDLEAPVPRLRRNLGVG